MIPTCDCPGAKQGNMCKHQCKALIVKGHARRSIIKQFGSKAGSRFEGMEPIEEQGRLLYSEESEPSVGSDGQEVPNSELGLIEALPDASQLDSMSHRDKCVDKSRQAFLEMEKMATQSDSIAQSMQAKLSQTLNALKIQEHSQLVCGKEVLTTADMFVRPNGLTLKRRLAVVDKYHGAAKRTKRLLNSYLKRKRQQDQERDGGDFEQALDKVTEQTEKIPDVIPEVRKRKREIPREEMYRRSMHAKGKRKSRKHNSESSLVVPPPPRFWKSPSGARDLAAGTVAVDLNKDLNRDVTEGIDV